MKLKIPKLFISSFLFALLITPTIFAQGFLHREGKYIFDGSGNEVILRGIGTGNWMIQEGYMMQSSGPAGTQHEFRAELIKTIGEEKTDSFYTAWLDSHFRRIDVDSMKSWGFNSIRVAMHYKWFTPPIDDELVPGEITWLEKGFTMMDSLLDWCSDNEMYLILDMHGAPGGQGKNADISDYDSSKPSLWESRDNKDKLVALWKKLAQRYSTEPWMGGYDLINETNWPLPNNNKDLWDLHKEITYAIREVDNNHLIFIEGNGFANDYNGLPTIWDENLALSFHKYWSYNDAGSISWMLNLRNQRNVPIWLGESGENSNTWFSNCIALCQKNRIGWSWWPVKKPETSNPLRVTINEDYTKLINYWKGSASNPGVDAAFNAVLQFAANHRLENCNFQRDVVDAMIRQPHTTETIPFKIYKTGEPIFATDYNLGRNGFAYFDNDTANYNLSTGEYVTWNKGWAYRNDGVDIETCNDSEITNGFSVGWTGNGEWMEYTVIVDSTASYTLDIRSASGSTGSKIHLKMDGTVVSPVINLNGTSGWYNWRTTTADGILLTKGTHKIKFVFEQGGSNLNYFKFSNPISTDSLTFKPLSAESSEDGKFIYLSLNMPVSSNLSEVNLTDFSVSVDNTQFTVSTLTLDTKDSNLIVIGIEEKLYYGGTIYLSYQGKSIYSSNQTLETFTDLVVTNKLPLRVTLPARIQSEDFYFNNGLVSESCNDVGGGLDMGYAAPGDYLDYLVYVPETRYYNFYFRVASERSTSKIIIRTGEGNSFTGVDTLTITSTGGWQNWETVSTTALLPEGRYTLRMYVWSGEFNTNWFQANKGATVGVQTQKQGTLQVYPNPANDFVNIDLSGINGSNFEISICNALGQTVRNIKSPETLKIRVEVSDLNTGLYYIRVKSDNNLLQTTKLIIQ